MSTYGTARRSARGVNGAPLARFALFWLLALCASWAAPVGGGVALAASAAASNPWDGLIRRLAADGYDRATVAALFARVQQGPEEQHYSSEYMGRKLLALYRRKYERAPAAKRATAQRTPPVYKQCLTPERMSEARDFLYGNHFLLNRFVSRWGVPRELAVAILSVETRIGRVLGTTSAFVTLACMAATDEWSQVADLFVEKGLTSGRRAWLARRQAEKADWAYEELTALLDHALGNGLDPLELPGSAYGAIGICQFMPSNAVRFGVDGDGDGRVNLFTRADALHSMGRFLQANGWKGRMNRASMRKVLYRYNHSRTYIETVLTLADRLGASGHERDMP
ncbi:MAG: lytic murein transglycosylase [Desulfovibrionaceae bacterium]|jgi:membrane-bound lytic murein transglycosylase B|nr:lytic murein transglycosylase [Desulfovibrionaceae bacterium]